LLAGASVDEKAAMSGGRTAVVKAEKSAVLMVGTSVDRSAF
jgi:hypothetical protein